MLTFATYILNAIPINAGMSTFMSVNNMVLISAVPGNVCGFASDRHTASVRLAASLGPEW